MPNSAILQTTESQVGYESQIVCPIRSSYKQETSGLTDTTRGEDRREEAVEQETSGLIDATRSEDRRREGEKEVEQEPSGLTDATSGLILR